MWNRSTPDINDQNVRRHVTCDRPQGCRTGNLVGLRWWVALNITSRCCCIFGSSYIYPSPLLNLLCLLQFEEFKFSSKESEWALSARSESEDRKKLGLPRPENILAVRSLVYEFVFDSRSDSEIRKVWSCCGRLASSAPIARIYKSSSTPGSEVGFFTPLVRIRSNHWRALPFPRIWLILSHPLQLQSWTDWINQVSFLDCVGHLFKFLSHSTFSSFGD